MKKIFPILYFLLVFIAAPLSAQVLNVSRITQSQTEWCWAGTSACILEFYGKKIPQCQIAEYARTSETFSDISFGNQDCCVSPTSCNMWNNLYGGPGSIADILIHFSNLGSNTVTTELTLAEITTLMENNRPFVMRWGWTSGGGHFLVGHGISGENIYYMNPWPGEGKKIGTYSWMKSTSDHTWTHSTTLYPTARPPADAGAISGPASVCQGQSRITYRVPPIYRALSYIWTLPEGFSGASQTDSISVSFNQNAKSGNITVAGQNNLGTGVGNIFPVTVNPLPEAAGAISGPALVCQRQRNVTYQVPVIKNATSYSWTVNADATGSSTGNSITLDFGLNTGEGTIRVKGLNDCGEGPEYQLNIKLSVIPDPPVITQKGNDLTSSSFMGNQWYNANGPIPGATSQIYTITETGDYYVVVTIDGCISDPSETLTVVLNGVGEVIAGEKFRIYPNPTDGIINIESSGSSEPVLFHLLNSLGQVVHQSTLINSVTVNLSSFPKGLYLLRFFGGKGSQVRRLVIQ